MQRNFSRTLRRVQVFDVQRSLKPFSSSAQARIGLTYAGATHNKVIVVDFGV